MPADATEQPDRALKAEFIRFWCRRASEGRSRSRARAKVTAAAALRAIWDYCVYAVSPGHRADVIVLAHPDRGAKSLRDVPYVGELTARLAETHNVVFLQMQRTRPVAGVVAYPWLAMRILGQLKSRSAAKLGEDDQRLAAQLADQYQISVSSVAERLQRLNFELGQWRRLLRRYRPKTIVLVDGYSSNAALIWIARQMSIRTIEVQHGACGASHAGYSMVGASTYPLAPDYFLTWNSYWRDRMQQVPGYGARVKVCRLAAQDLASQVSESAELNGILLIHQPTLSQLMHDLLLQLPDRKDAAAPVVVKYHPGIQPDWEQTLSALCLQKGVRVLKDRRIEDVIGEYGTVVGWFSTVLFQAAEAGYVVRALPAPGYELQQAPLFQKGIQSLTVEAFLVMASP